MKQAELCVILFVFATLQSLTLCQFTGSCPIVIPGRDGRDGNDGAPGHDGVPGRDGLVGRDGSKGDKGDEGVKGDRGFYGAKGSPGDRGVNGTNGQKGNIGVRGPKGVPGPQGTQGSKGATGPEGPSGPKGSSGSQGPTGPKGTPGSQPILRRNVQQFTWTDDSDADNGKIKSFTFMKARSDTSLWVSFSGTARMLTAGRCNRWFITFNDTECANPAKIDAVIYQSNTNNIHRHLSLDGICESLASGRVQIALNIGACRSGQNTGDAHTGWNSVSRLIVEELETN